jgi:hypothetical protein
LRAERMPCMVGDCTGGGEEGRTEEGRKVVEGLAVAMSLVSPRIRVKAGSGPASAP